MADQEMSHHGIDDSSSKKYPNETMRLLIERSSCRSFYDRPIPDDVLAMILEAGNRAATGGNLQPFSIIKIIDPAVKKEVDRLCGEQEFISTAPVDLLFCLDWYRLKCWAEIEEAPFSATSSFRHFWISFQDTIIAAQNICTAADALGLGSVYVGTVLECFRELRQIFDLPEGVFPVVLLSLGYPKARPMPKKKLGVKTIVHDGKYHKMNDTEIKTAFENKYPGFKRELTAERLERYETVCRRVRGEQFAKIAVERVKNQGYFNAIQNYFGLHYAADLMPEGNDDFLAMVKEFGFFWFEEYQSSNE
ncbi:Nitroreductase [Candidatus Zixiibacteriota bacterium]|nr:Nitroreductase [candidate division Zixibacteria bacterium]